MANADADLTNVQIEPHGLRNVEFVHKDFRRRMLDKYGRCTKMAADVAAVETTCKAVANLVGESNDIISIVYGINTLKVNKLTDLTVDSIDQCYMDAAMDATKRLSVCTDIYYKNKDASTQHQDIEADGETGGTGEGVVKVQYGGKNVVEFGENNILAPIILSGNVTGEIDITITPRNATIRGLQSNEDQLINSDMVYELPMHTLDAVNTEISQLTLSPDSTGMSYIEIRVDGNIAKTLSFTVVDNTDLSVETTPGVVYVGESTGIAPIVVSGLMQSAVEISVEPTNCAIVGFKSRPAYTVTSGSTYTFKSDNLTAINNELANLSILADMVGGCQVKVTYPGGSKIFQYSVQEPVQVPTAELEFSMTTDSPVSIILGERNPIPSIVAIGTVNDSTRVVVSPSNCTLNGFASDPNGTYCSNATYSFIVADVDSINRELSSLYALPSMVGPASVAVSFNDGINDHTVQFDFTVKSVPINVIVPTVDTCEKLEPNDFTTIKPIVFRGKLEKASTTVTMSVVNAEVKGVSNTPDMIFNEESNCTVTATSLSQLNSLFANIQVKPVQSGGVSLIFTIDHADVYTFSFDIKDEYGAGDDYTNFVELRGNGSDDQLVVNTLSDAMSIVFSSVVDSGMNVTITPHNCTMVNVKSTPTVEYNETNPYNAVVESRSSLNDELSNIKIMPTATENVNLSINVSDFNVVVSFNNVVAQ